MLRQYEKSKSNENQVEESSSQGKGGGVKQFGLSSSNKFLNNSQNTETGLKFKSNSQEIKSNSQEFYKPLKNDKSSIKSELSPQKRTVSTAGLKVYSDKKKQHIHSIEKTHRHREQEIEWAPEGLDLDFSAFDSSKSSPIQSYSSTKEITNDSIELDDYPIMTRRFEVEEATPISVVVEEEQEYDTSTIEYGPAKEIELPYVPDESCTIDYNVFEGQIDPSAYESTRLSKKDTLEFSAFDDLDALSQLTDNKTSLEFNHYASDDEPEMTTDEDTDIPFSSHFFDVDHYIKSN